MLRMTVQRLAFAALVPMQYVAAQLTGSAAVDALKDKSYLTRVPVGVSMTFQRRIDRANVVRHVETSIGADGVIEYLAVAGRSEMVNGVMTITIFGPMDPPFTVAAARLTRAIPAGSRVQVKRVEWKSDRVDLVVIGDAGEGRLRFLFGVGIQKTASRQAMLGQITRVLVIADFERERQYISDLADLRWIVRSNRDAFDAATDVGAKFAAGTALVTQLRAMEQVAMSLRLVSSDPADSGAAAVSRERAVLEPVVDSLGVVVRSQRLAELGPTQRLYDRQVDSLFARLDTGSPATLADWRKRAEDVAAVRQLIALQRLLHTELQSMSIEPGSDAKTRVDGEVAHLERVQSTLDSNVDTIRRLEVDGQFIDINGKLAAQREHYTRAYGSSSQPAEATRLLTLLQNAYDNRVLAASLGSKTAAAQAERIQAELARVRRQQPPLAQFGPLGRSR